MARVVGSSMTECGEPCVPHRVRYQNQITGLAAAPQGRRIIAGGRMCLGFESEPGPLASGGKKDFRGAFD